MDTAVAEIPLPSPREMTVKNKWPEPDKKSMDAHFGRVELSQDDIVAARWFNSKMTRTRLPWKTYLGSKDLEIRLELLHFNNEVAPSIHRICARILRELGDAAPEANGLDIIGGHGAFLFDRNRGILSESCWGALINFDPTRNPYQSEKTKQMRGYHIDDRIIGFFEDENWHWHGRNKRHFDPGTFTATSR